MQYWTAEETKTFLDVAAGKAKDADGNQIEPDSFYSLYVTAITTGMRLGEILGLQWDDVDLVAGTIAVQHNLILTEGNGYELAEPKSDSGRRLIELPKVAITALHEHRKQMLSDGLAASKYVFCDSKGGYLRQSNFIRRNYKPLLKRANVREIRFHDLRHTSATLLLLQGEHPKVVQERLGHSRISMTLDTYSHVLPSMQKDAAEKLNRLLA
jgi:integrase